MVAEQDVLWSGHIVQTVIVTHGWRRSAGFKLQYFPRQEFGIEAIGDSIDAQGGRHHPYGADTLALV